KSLVCLLFCWFFFFQAEDGIRDFHVTGVQTCALPISVVRSKDRTSAACSGPSKIETHFKNAMRAKQVSGFLHNFRIGLNQKDARSEERRVGKEGRTGGER